MTTSRGHRSERPTVWPQPGQWNRHAGSDLRRAPTEERWYCTGSGADAQPCTRAVTGLPDPNRPVKAPFDGVVTRWQVDSAGGPISLVVLRGEVNPKRTVEPAQGAGIRGGRGAR